VGDTETIKLIKRGVDLYVDMAATIYNVSPEQVTKEQRALGKTAILGLGYGMGANEFLATCQRFGIEIDRALAKKTVRLYRQKYKKVVQYWRKINDHAIQKTGPFSMYGKFLRFQLKSGRYLYYYDPQIVINRFDQPAISYMSFNYVTQKEERKEMYGGIWTENEDQAIARDIMALGMLRVEEAGYPIVLTSHDEVVSEIDSKFGTIEEFVTLLTKRPSWAKDCPIDAEGWRGKRYRK
jgi:DNA polymerase